MRAPSTTSQAPTRAPDEWMLRIGPISAVVERRRVLVLALLAVTVTAAGFLTLCWGSQWTPPGDVVEALRGIGDNTLIVREWRLPRTLAGILFGAALGVAGALLQNLTRNPLGSPDIIGLDSGAYTGALVAMTLLSPPVVGATSVAAGSSASPLSVAVCAVIGGLLAAGVVIALSLRSGLSGLRLIVIGIAVNAILTAVNGWIVLRAEYEVALTATGWNAGSLNGIDRDELALPALILGIGAIACLVLARPVQQLALGDAIAQSTGVRLRALRLAMILTSLLCTATVTAVAGPIVFVALAAPQIGRRLVGGTGTTLLPAALTGALLLVLADWLAQRLLSPESLPVGVITTCLGGGYLIWLLQGEVRRARTQ